MTITNTERVKEILIQAGDCKSTAHLQASLDELLAIVERMEKALVDITDGDHADTCDTLKFHSETFPCSCHVKTARAALRGDHER